MRIRRLPGADRDVDEIWSYIAQDNPEAATRMVARIAAATDRLRDFPESAMARLEIHSTARSIRIASYVIYYRIGLHTIDVVRILHAARDTSSLAADFDR